MSAHVTDGFATIADLAKAAAAGGSEGLPPIHRWNPARCGDVPMRIRADGVWFHEGTPIGRERLVRLFSTILLREEDGSYHLVTPAEKARIEVEDAPFIAVELRREGRGDAQDLYFRTNVGDWTKAGPAKPLRVEEDEATGQPAPYVLVRDRLEAKIARPVFYRLADIAEERDGRFVVRSDGVFFDIGPAA